MGQNSALIVATAIGAVAATAALLLEQAVFLPSTPAYFASALIVAVLVLTLIVAFALFLPIRYLFSRFGRTGFRATVLSGALSGLIAALVIFWPPLGKTLPSFLYELCYCSAIGGFGALIFHLVLARLSPNNSFKPKPLRGSA